MNQRYYLEKIDQSKILSLILVMNKVQNKFENGNYSTKNLRKSMSFTSRKKLIRGNKIKVTIRVTENSKKKLRC